PDQFLLTEISRNANAKDEPVAPGKKMSGLSLIGGTRLDVVVGTDREIDFLLPVSVEVPEHEGIGAVRILLPPLVGSGDVLAGWQRDLRAGHRNHDQHCNYHQRESPRPSCTAAEACHRFRPPTVRAAGFRSWRSGTCCSRTTGSQSRFDPERDGASRAV